MSEQTYTYAIVGGGLAGASAVEGIRELDPNGSIVVIGQEKHLPYDRPPLSKKLWFGKKKVEEIFVHDRRFYERNGVRLELGARVVSLDVERKTLADEKGTTYVYEKLLLATGGIPRVLSIPGGRLEGVCYYRYLDDYQLLKNQAGAGKSALVIGGGFIGSEMAAALNANKVEVTMLFPGPYLVSRVFHENLGRAVQREYEERGVRILATERPASISRRGGKFVTVTSKGTQIESDLVIAGVGVAPDVSLAERAGLRVGNGVVVSEYLQTSHPGIYAAGDNALFPCRALGRSMRIEHWDNALNQGKWAGRNMAGAWAPFTYLPYFFSDLFDFGYEAVGEVDSELHPATDWQVENVKGIVYYLREGRIRGMMMCNVWEKVDEARRLIEAGEHMVAGLVDGALR